MSDFHFGLGDVGAFLGALVVLGIIIKYFVNVLDKITDRFTISLEKVEDRHHKTQSEMRNILGAIQLAIQHFSETLGQHDNHAANIGDSITLQIAGKLDKLEEKIDALINSIKAPMK